MTEVTQALLAGTQAARDALDLRMIPVEEIAADANQPRKTFDAAKLAELGESLKQGQTNAIKVRARRADEQQLPLMIKWVLMHGERRLRAARKMEIPRLRAEVAWDIGPDDAHVVLLDQIADNLQREDLGAVEEAAAIRRYAKISGFGTRALAAQLGKKESYVSFALGMKKMPTDLVKRIEQNARGVGVPDGEPYALTWKHLRQLLRLTDQPERLIETYNDAVMDRSTARELEGAVTRELEYLEQRRKREAAAAKAKKEGKPAPAPSAPTPINQLSEERQREALEAARMTRARKDLIRGTVPEIVRQVGQIAELIQLPKGLAVVAAERISGYDIARLSQSSTKYGENIASLVVPALPGDWGGWAGRGGTPLGSALNAGRRAEDDEAGRYWLAFAYWLATETKGMDADLDRQSREVLKARDQRVSKIAKAKTTQVTSSDKPEMKKCAKDGCATMFAIYKKPGRHPKYCARHRSR